MTDDNIIDDNAKDFPLMGGDAIPPATQEVKEVIRYVYAPFTDDAAHNEGWLVANANKISAYLNAHDGEYGDEALAAKALLIEALNKSQ